jgi:hypothetical protein
MPKKDIKDLLGKRSPGELRKGVQQIDILQEAAAALSSPGKETNATEQESSSVQSAEKIVEESSEEKAVKSSEAKSRPSKPSEKGERKNRSVKARKKPRVYSKEDIVSVLAVDKRETERYSFEIYSDQKQDIQRVCDLYEKATGKKLSASRLIREVLDTFLPDALKTFEPTAEE